VLILFFLDIRHEHTSFVDGIKAVDWYGIFTFLGCTLMLLLGLDFGGVLFPWDSAKIIALLVVGGLMIFAFIYSEKRLAKYPLIPMSLFRKRTNVAAFSLVFFHGFVSSSLATNIMMTDCLGLHRRGVLHAIISPVRPRSFTATFRSSPSTVHCYWGNARSHRRPLYPSHWTLP
jgi:hypothetical protein